ncbi:MAG: hypothetical protein JWL62_1741 [Hyphomicrobiales bacterium]|nr:hypothetical protein [Hyphomicrobiales bacterium]
MAELSEADRRILLGANFEEVEARHMAEARAPVSDAEKQQSLVRTLAKNSDRRFTAMALLLSGAFMTWASYHQAHAVDVPGLIGATGLAAGLGWYAWLVQSGRTMTTRLAAYAAA